MNPTYRTYIIKKKKPCADCGKKLDASEESTLDSDGNTIGSYPPRPKCHDCESIDEALSVAWDKKLHK